MCASHLSRIKSIKREETQSHKPDPDTSAWLETFLITNSWLWVTRVGAQHEEALTLFRCSPPSKGLLSKTNSEAPRPALQVKQPRLHGSDPCQTHTLTNCSPSPLPTPARRTGISTAHPTSKTVSLSSYYFSCLSHSG